MIALDSSVVIALLDPLDSHHGDAVALIRSHSNHTFLMHPINIAEVLVRAVREGVGVQKQADLDTLGITPLPHSRTASLQLAEIRVRTGLRMPDCCVLLAASDGVEGLATFDHALRAAAQQLGVRVIG
jgi:predicted nucleic acid-binding protein